MMVKSRRDEVVVAYALMTPFIIVYGVIFVWPSIKLFELSFTDAPLIGEGAWVGFKNFWRLQSDRLFSTAIWNTIYFVALSVVPSTLIALAIALGVNRLKGRLQSVVLAAFSFPTSCRCRSYTASGAGCSTRTSASRNTSLLRLPEVSTSRSSARFRCSCRR